MEKKLRIFSLVLLLVLGSSAIGEGWILIGDPSGFSRQLSTDLLNQTLFDNYLFSGVILLVAVGFISIMVAILAIKRSVNYPLCKSSYRHYIINLAYHGNYFEC